VCAGEIKQNTYTGCESVTYIPEYQTILTMVFLFPQLRMTLLCVETLRYIVDLTFYCAGFRAIHDTLCSTATCWRNPPASNCICALSCVVIDRSNQVGVLYSNRPYNSEQILVQ